MGESVVQLQRILEMAVQWMRNKSESRREALCAEGAAGKVTQVLCRSPEDSESIPDIGIKIYILNCSLALFSL